MPDERIGIFIDGANFHATARALGFEIDYKKLLDHFRQAGRLVRAHYYTSILDDGDFNSLRPLLDFLDYNGYAVVTKAAKEFVDAAGNRKVKGNMDIEIAVDALELAPRLDHVILFTGDGDMRSLVEAIQRRGVRVSIASTIRTRPPMAADELRRQADDFLEVDGLRAVAARAPRSTTTQQAR